jgi:hypothetical protein
MKRIVIFLIGIVASGTVIAQKIDDQRMNRDLEVARNILSTLIKTEAGGMFGGESIEASFVEGYGVIFTIPRHMVFFKGSGPMIGMDKNVIRITAPEGVDEQELQWHVQREMEHAQKEVEKAQQEMEIAQEEMEHTQKELKEIRIEVRDAGEGKEGKDKVVRKEVIVEVPDAPETPDTGKEMRVVVAPDAPGSRRMIVTTGAPFPAAEVDWEKVMLTFLGDYADLIGQLQPDQRIMVRQEKPFGDLPAIWVGEEGGEIPGGITAEVKKGDITAYKTGKINQEEFNKRVSIVKSEPQKKVADLEMFSSILSRFFSPDLSETFFTEGKPGYEVLDKFGVVFNLNTYSSYIESGQFYMPMQGKRVMVSPEERKEKIETLYPKFLTDLRNFVIDYGRTIRSVPEGEKLLLKVKLTKCEGCKIPKSLELSVPMSTLRQFDQQKLSREKAVAAIEIKEL